MLWITFIDDSTGASSPGVKLIDVQKAKPCGGNLKSISASVYFPRDFGNPGAVIVQPTQRCTSNFLYMKSISISGLRKGIGKCSISFPCNSWVSTGQGCRVFFTEVPTVPRRTPACILKLREADLAVLSRGNGQIMHMADRIYGYEIYNDLPSPEEAIKRRDWGGERSHPFPRR